MIVVTGELRLPPAKLGAARAPMRALIEATRREAGCLLYAYGEDVLDPGLFRIIERWQDAAALDAHSTAPHVDAWRAALKEIGVLKRDVWAYEATDGRAI